MGTDAGQACADVSSGLDKPDTSGRDERKPTCVRSVLIGLRELCRENGLNEVFTAYLVGRLGDWWLFPGFASVGGLTTYRKKRP